MKYFMSEPTSKRAELRICVKTWWGSISGAFLGHLVCCRVDRSTRASNLSDGKAVLRVAPNAMSAAE